LVIDFSDGQDADTYLVFMMKPHNLMILMKTLKEIIIKDLIGGRYQQVIE
jgi:hypothetical protein